MAPCPGAGQTNTKYKTAKWHLAQVEANTASRLIFEVEGGDSDRGFAAVDEILVRKVDICATTPTNAVPGMKLKIGGSPELQNETFFRRSDNKWPGDDHRESRFEMILLLWLSSWL